MSAAGAIKFIESLSVPTGPRAGRKLKLAPYQRRFLQGALAPGVMIAALSVARGGGKSALSAGVGLGHLVGKIDPQVRRECLIGARSRDQGRIAYDYMQTLAQSLPDDLRKRLTWRKAPRLEVTFEDDTGPHVARVVPSDGRTALGSSPTLCIADERAFWSDRGEELEAALLSGLGKRGGRYIAISTSANSDAHAFSRLLDDPPVGAFVQEHRADAGCVPDDIEQIRKANPGAEYGIGASLEWIQAGARRAIQRGGTALSSFRLLNLNQRVSNEARALLLSTDEWLRCEVETLPAREGPCVVGLDLGGSSSMSALAYFWPTTGRLECRGAFPSHPDLLARGQADGVGDRYCQMRDRGELQTLGDRVVPAREWLATVAHHVDGSPIAALCADRYRQSEVMEAVQASGLRCPISWRGQGWRDGAEDVERFRTACADGRVKSAESLLMRSALADAVCVTDVAGNAKLAKGRSLGRIDAAAAAILAVAEGARITGRTTRKSRGAVWA